jgi:hypothetical protein
VELQNPEELIALGFAPAGVVSPAPPACWPQQRALIFPLDSSLIELLDHADPRNVFRVSRFIASFTLWGGFWRGNQGIALAVYLSNHDNGLVQRPIPQP